MAGRIAILGAGAGGGMLGVLLAEAGNDVTLLASDRTSTAINIDGLTLRSTRVRRVARLDPDPTVADRRSRRPVRHGPVKAPDLLAALTRVPAPLLRGA